MPDWQFATGPRKTGTPVTAAFDVLTGSSADRSDGERTIITAATLCAGTKGAAGRSGPVPLFAPMATAMHAEDLPTPRRPAASRSSPGA